MKKTFAACLFCLLIGLYFQCSAFSLKRNKEKAYIVLSKENLILNPPSMPDNQPVSVFSANKRIYFYVYNPDSFKSDYVRYQIIKQDDNAHVGGYSRVRNITRRLKDKNSFSDYFVLTGAGKYAIQIFDITNLNQWVAFGAFRVVED